MYPPTISKVFTPRQPLSVSPPPGTLQSQQPSSLSLPPLSTLFTLTIKILNTPRPNPSFSDKSCFSGSIGYCVHCDEYGAVGTICYNCRIEYPPHEDSSTNPASSLLVHIPPPIPPFISILQITSSRQTPTPLTFPPSNDFTTPPPHIHHHHYPPPESTPRTPYHNSPPTFSTPTPHPPSKPMKITPHLATTSIHHLNQPFQVPNTPSLPPYPLKTLPLLLILTIDQCNDCYALHVQHAMM